MRLFLLFCFVFTSLLLQPAVARPGEDEGRPSDPPAELVKRISGGDGNPFRPPQGWTLLQSGEEPQGGVPGPSTAEFAAEVEEDEFEMPPPASLLPELPAESTLSALSLEELMRQAEQYAAEGLFAHALQCAYVYNNRRIDDPLMMRLIGHCLMMQGRLDEAWRFLERAGSAGDVLNEERVWCLLLRLAASPDTVAWNERLTDFLSRLQGSARDGIGSLFADSEGKMSLPAGLPPTLPEMLRAGKCQAIPDRQNAWLQNELPADTAAVSLATLEILIQRFPAHFGLRLRLGDALRTDKPLQAESWYRQAAALRPLDPRPPLRLAELAVGRQQFALARDWVAGILAGQPDHAEALALNVLIDRLEEEALARRRSRLLQQAEEQFIRDGFIPRDRLREESDGKTALVLGDQWLRDGNGSDFRRLLRVSDGLSVEIIARVDGWVHVRVPETNQEN